MLTDELTEQDKAKRPFIPFEERMEIVKQCKYVDRVVSVDFIIPIKLTLGKN